jgi:nucleoside-diphosphate-sugar epimerase
MNDSNRRTPFIVDRDAPILITGANGFIGSRVVAMLIRTGFSNLRCFVRPSSNLTKLNEIIASDEGRQVKVIQGNLLSRDDCARAAKDAAIVIHLAAGIEKTFAGCFLNSVVTTRNLLDAVVAAGTVRRFVNISSFSVYSNWKLPSRKVLDETCELEQHPLERAEPYMFAKLKQDELVLEYSQKHQIQHVMLRPGAVCGPGAHQLTARVGIDTFGVFLHLGGSNKVPLTYVDNCAEAIVLAGLSNSTDGQVFNVVDDDLPTSRQFLRMYKRQAKPIKSIYVPYRLFYGFCWLWEKYSRWSQGQLPPVFNRRRCATYWKGNAYSNQKLKQFVGWKPRVPFSESSRLYFESARSGV